MDLIASSSSANHHKMSLDFVKLDRFDGNNYSRWADKMRFLLVVLNISYVLDPNPSNVPEDPIPKSGNDGKDVDAKAIADLEMQRTTRIEHEELCCGYIKNSLSGRLYDLYASIKNPRELWNALENKYKAHEQGTNKYLVSKYMEFQMVDGKSILEQVHELQILVNKLKSLTVTLPKFFKLVQL